MPRATTGSNHFYHSQFNSHYVHDDDQPSQHPHGQNHSQQCQSQSTPTHPQSVQPAPQKKKHVCPTCDRAFTTSGHLARHSRVHTGERNHKCPFPGCETRCSRQDNLQQHYRIHLSPGSRRSSTRSAIARAMNNSIQPLSGSSSTRRSSTSSSSLGSPTTIPPLSSPPALEPARYPLSTPPDSPPPLAHATLPATAHPPPDSSSSRSSSSPEISYSPVTPHHHSQIVPMSSQPINISGQNYSHYRSGTTTYQEQSQGAGFTYVHTTPISHTNNSHSTSFSYSGASYDSHHSNIHDPPHHSSHQHHSQQHHHHHHSPPSPPSNHVSPIASRHSISHISHPQQPSYQSGPPSNPPSPASSHSASSQHGPSTSSYPVFHDDAHSYQGGNMIVDHTPDHPAVGGGHISSLNTLVHPNYSPTLPLPAHAHSLPSRFDSPPPTLAPIQDERLVRGDSHGRHSHGPSSISSHHSSSSSSYIHHHHSQSLGNGYQYHHQSMGLGHAPWKADGPLRGKAIGTLVQ